MDHASTPEYVWYEALQYASTLHNHASKPILKNKTPIEQAFGTAPDISALIQCLFYEPMLKHHTPIQENYQEES